MFASQHISVAALCLALFSLPLSMAQGAATTTMVITTTTTATAAPSATPRPTIAPGSDAWTYYGCYNETTGSVEAGKVRALSANMTASDTQTAESCINLCGSMSYTFAGLEYGRECYCGPNINSNSVKLNDNACGIPCMGDTSEICGGLLSLTVYKRVTSSPSTSDATALSSRTKTLVGPFVASLLALGGLGLVAL